MHISSLVQSYRLPGYGSRSSGDHAQAGDERSFPSFDATPSRPTIAPARTSRTLEALLAESALDRSMASPLSQTMLR